MFSWFDMVHKCDKQRQTDRNEKAYIAYWTWNKQDDFSSLGCSVQASAVIACYSMHWSSTVN